MQELTEVLYFLECLTNVTSISFTTPWNGSSKRRTFRHCHAASIKTPPLSCKDCLTGYKYEKAAVISEHHTHIGSSQVLQYPPGSLSRGTSTTLHNTITTNSHWFTYAENSIYKIFIMFNFWSLHKPGNFFHAKNTWYTVCGFPHYLTPQLRLSITYWALKSSCTELTKISIQIHWVVFV